MLTFAIIFITFMQKNMQKVYFEYWLSLYGANFPYNRNALVLRAVHA